MSDPILPLAVWEEGTLQNDVPANDNALRVEAMRRPVLGTEDSPTSSIDGDVFFVGGSPSGAFATFDPNDIAIYRGGNWYAWAPVQGLQVNGYVYTGSAGWTASGGGGGGAVDSVNGQTGIVVLALDDLDDVDATTPTDQDVLTWDAGSSSWIPQAAGGGGLTNWTEGVNTSAPNNAGTPVATFTATNAATNVDAALIAKGQGATLAQTPDNSTTGGNKRGANATDWQKLRSANTQVASGARSTVGGGQRNTASADETTVAGGYQNTASVASATVAGGRLNTASATGASVLGGDSNVASGNYASVVGGNLNDADGACSTAMGYKAQCRGIQGAVARAYGGFNNFDGDGQSRAFYLCQSTTNATQTTATTDRGAAGTANQIVLPNNSAFVIKGTINVRENATGDSSAWEFTAYIKRGANAAATAMVVACTPTLIGQDAGAAAWAVSVDADTTNGALRCRVTGEASHNLKWGWDIYSCNEVVS